MKRICPPGFVPGLRQILCTPFNQSMDYRPEELINRHLRHLTSTANITRGIGTLAFLWFTVLLLRGFAFILGVKEFWILTALSFLMAFRVVENWDNEFRRGIYMEEAKIIAFIRRQKWLDELMARLHRTTLGMVLLPKFILLCILFLSLNVMPYASFGISVWRLLQRDYGNAGGDASNTAKLRTALDIFYALVLFQSLLVIYWNSLNVLLKFSVVHVAQAMSKQCGHEKWSSKLVAMYCLETRRKFRKDGELPNSWNLMTYGLELLDSVSGDDDHRWGARVLDKLFYEDKSIRQGLLYSRLSIHNLIGMIGRRGTVDDIEKRERAARIVAHLATDLHIARFPGILQCICSLLDPRYIAGHVLDGETHASDTAVLITTGQTYLRRTSFHETYVRGWQHYNKFLQEVKNFSETKYHHLYQPMGAKELVSQGLLILERLTQDGENCTEIIKDQRLLSIITAPLRSHDILSKLCDNTKVLKVLSRLLTSPGDGAARLCQELASSKEVVSNLMGIVETDRKCAHKLHGEALKILTELAFDGSLKKQELNKLFKTLMCILFKEKIMEQEERESATRLMGNSGKALARLLPICTARGILSQEEAINLSTMVLDQILSSEMGRTHGNKEDQSEETEFITAMLSLTMVMCDKNKSSKEYFAHPTPKDTELVKMLKEILEANKRRSPECLRIVKLICHVVIAMIKVKSSCTRHFNEHNFRAALTRALETMSEVDYRNDCEAINPVRCLASLVKELQELLQTAATFSW